MKKRQIKKNNKKHEKQSKEFREAIDELTNHNCTINISLEDFFSKPSLIWNKIK